MMRLEGNNPAGALSLSEKTLDLGASPNDYLKVQGRRLYVQTLTDDIMTKALAFFGNENAKAKLAALRAGAAPAIRRIYENRFGQDLTDRVFRALHARGVNLDPGVQVKHLAQIERDFDMLRETRITLRDRVPLHPSVSLADAATRLGIAPNEWRKERQIALPLVAQEFARHVPPRHAVDLAILTEDFLDKREGVPADDEMAAFRTKMLMRFPARNGLPSREAFESIAVAAFDEQGPDPLPRKPLSQQA